MLAKASTAVKNRALEAAADLVRDHREALLAANRRDLAEAPPLAPAMRDRLVLDDGRIAAMARGIEEVAALDDPVGTVVDRWQRPNGLAISRVRVPLGVIGIIYESRPNVTADAGALCLKSGNAVILRGGSESFHSSHAIHACLVGGLARAGLPEGSVQLVATRDRAAVGELLRLSDHVDVIVPRGGRSLIERVREESRIPVISHLDGNCHVYVDRAPTPPWRSPSSTTPSCGAPASAAPLNRCWSTARRWRPISPPSSTTSSPPAARFAAMPRPARSTAAWRRPPRLTGARSTSPP